MTTDWRGARCSNALAQQHTVLYGDTCGVAERVTVGPCGRLWLGGLTTRRRWLAQQTVTAMAMLVPRRSRRGAAEVLGRRGLPALLPREAVVPRMDELAPGLMQALAHQAVDAAMAAGAQYADARLTRTVRNVYTVDVQGHLIEDDEDIGVGVRVLADGYWGFAASPYWAADEAARLAQDAVAQARANAKGPARAVELGSVPVVTGIWGMPVRIDPFTISIEEKMDQFAYWADRGLQWDLVFMPGAWMAFARQERVLATSAGSLVTQTLYEAGGDVAMISNVLGPGGGRAMIHLEKLGWTGQGWEVCLDANIPDQIPQLLEEWVEFSSIPVTAAAVGRYTVVCDGATMTSLLASTIGAATQLDRALGYEADAVGTSFLDDPLGMVGTFNLAAPAVTVMANRTAPTGLATVRWDDEGVVPETVPLVKEGVLVDFQTTRESAGWLAPYYRRSGKPVQSHGYAGAPDALSVPMQHMPNLELAANPAAVGLTNLVSDVKNGVLVEQGRTMSMDFQARNGLLVAVGGGRMREIHNGKLGRTLLGGAVSFNSTDLWRNVGALGGAATQMMNGWSRFDPAATFSSFSSLWNEWDQKGQPTQMASYSARAAAATLLNQPLVGLTKRGR